jgi:hypothetical protein
MEIDNNVSDQNTKQCSHYFDSNFITEHIKTLSLLQLDPNNILLVGYRDTSTTQSIIDCKIIPFLIRSPPLKVKKAVYMLNYSLQNTQTPRHFFVLESTCTDYAENSLPGLRDRQEKFSSFMNDKFLDYIKKQILYDYSSNKNTKDNKSEKDVLYNRIITIVEDTSDKDSLKNPIEKQNKINELIAQQLFSQQNFSTWNVHDHYEKEIFIKGDIDPRHTFRFEKPVFLSNFTLQQDLKTTSIINIAERFLKEQCPISLSDLNSCNQGIDIMFYLLSNTNIYTYLPCEISDKDGIPIQDLFNRTTILQEDDYIEIEFWSYIFSKDNIIAINLVFNPTIYLILRNKTNVL